MIRKTIPLAFMALLLAAVPAMADPINITDGSLFYSRGNLAVFEAQRTDSWSVRAEFGEQEANYPVSSRCSDDCTPGTVVTLAQSESIVNTGDEFDRSVLGYFRLGGTEYYAKSMSFTIDADDFTLPDTVGSAPMLTPSFVFRGTMTGTSERGTQASVELFGTGRTSLSMGNNQWYATSYQFEDPAAVPEPGTLLLFATGAAAVVRRARQRRKTPITSVDVAASNAELS